MEGWRSLLCTKCALFCKMVKAEMSLGLQAGIGAAFKRDVERAYWACQSAWKHCLHKMCVLLWNLLCENQYSIKWRKEREFRKPCWFWLALWDLFSFAFKNFTLKKRQTCKYLQKPCFKSTCMMQTSGLPWVTASLGHHTSFRNPFCSCLQTLPASQSVPLDEMSSPELIRSRCHIL